mmetsp:Transcript_11544/g.29244  ORF Transcript_11544/g.29244 Transcript_11544/m.29244 type:complete len:209 (+) Transcript_11544:250-876(+)
MLAGVVQEYVSDGMMALAGSAHVPVARSADALVPSVVAKLEQLGSGVLEPVAMLVRHDVGQPLAGHGGGHQRGRVLEPRQRVDVLFYDCRHHGLVKAMRGCHHHMELRLSQRKVAGPGQRVQEVHGARAPAHELVFAHGREAGRGGQKAGKRLDAPSAVNLDLGGAERVERIVLLEALVHQRRHGGQIVTIPRALKWSLVANVRRLVR